MNEQAQDTLDRGKDSLPPDLYRLTSETLGYIWGNNQAVSAEWLLLILILSKSSTPLAMEMIISQAWVPSRDAYAGLPTLDRWQ